MGQWNGLFKGGSEIQGIYTQNVHSQQWSLASEKPTKEGKPQSCGDLHALKGLLI